MPRNKPTDNNNGAAPNKATPANNKTKPTNQSVSRYLDSIENAGRREDAYALLEIMQEVTGEQAIMWGPSIIGFGSYHYVYASGREGDSFLAGFAPRKANLVVYVMPGFSDYEELLSKLGPYKTGSSCLYLGRLNSIDIKVLKRLVKKSVADMRKKYP